MTEQTCEILAEVALIGKFQTAMHTLKKED